MKAFADDCVDEGDRTSVLIVNNTNEIVLI
jgi:hypothetical protein